ncbi:SVP1-like protein 2, variant [Neurospora crassa OR74A]|uniref:SVP1-like protein 2, variant n=1 Tax=Neurospora crassa (strain ATCC 24698 / 74-OR23-1A / CBS 708.71 / DSM 1257 / FGSC 987) TaxID=367110 RepID=V5IQ98_NEUCR|nr:SVP1-like protein 2, variant [Neurospora crassa OR74A]ESA43890.1 SVP1-like protein 2, variant [Neurospora crassa OR74A]|eukprot:XP_011392952.1 SVP1-like protein 2, variant [Neurospora crassa OR74A]
MDTRRILEHPVLAPVLSVTFNHDNSCFAVGLDHGFRIYESGSCVLRTSRDFGAGIGMVQMLGRTNILGLVGGGRQTKLSRNKLVLWDDKSKKQRIVLVLMDRVQVYQTAKPHPLLSTYETTDNPLGLCCLSSDRIAFPGRAIGHVQLVEVETGNVSIITAHTSALRAMALSQDGELLATASEMGTIIRVYATSNCARLYELRRGIDKAIIFSIGFSPSGKYLACTSDKSTLHVFDVTRPGGTRPITSNGGTAYAAGEPSVTGNNRPSSPYSVASSSGGGGGVMVNSNNGGSDMAADDGQGRWGFLSKLPLMPRIFSDPYSFASAKFEMADEPVSNGSREPLTRDGGLAIIGGPLKGNLGWISETEMVVIGAGRDPKWEKFAIQEGGQQDGYQGGGRRLVRVGWKRYGGETP